MSHDITMETFRKNRAQKACDENGNPSHQLKVFGVTGTNGKTTSTYLIEAMLRSMGYRPAVIGTVENRFESHSIPSTLTTPGSEELQRLLAQFRQLGADSVAIEVSSHALDQYRTWGTKFEAVLFTNLTQDHLDYHHTMENYYIAKRRLFFEYESRHKIVNTDDPWGQKLAHELRQSGAVVWTYGKSNADINFNQVVADAEGIHGTFFTSSQYSKRSIELSSPLLGQFNIQNLAQTAALGCALEFTPLEISKALSSCTGIPGRLERVGDSQSYNIIVDYAHTPDALQKALEALRPLCKGKLHVLFGCGGDRDPGKRPIMGKLAADLADFVYVTSDNPRTEDPAAIIDSVLGGIPVDTKARIQKIPDRRSAINEAVNQLQKDDVLLIAGKGHEDYQIVGTQKIYFDDRIEAKKALSAKKLM